MVYSYTPAYYTSLQDSIASICRSILPFSLKKKRLTAIAAAEQQLEKQQSENLKWQQDCFHQILRLKGLCREGIIGEDRVSDFRAHLLETLISSPAEYEASVILKDKLTFLQELVYMKCISEEEYDGAKKPLLARLEGLSLGHTVVKDEENKITTTSSATITDLVSFTENPLRSDKSKRKTWGFVKWRKNQSDPTHQQV